MEQNELVNNSAINDSSDKQKKCSCKELKIATIVASVVAICGVGFGVYGMIQSSQKDSQISDLKVQVKNGDGTTTTIETPKVETTTDGETTVTITDTVKVSGGPYIENDYFYVPDWGWKFKIPSDLTGLGFSVDYDEAHTGYDLPFIGFTAVQKSDLIANPQAQYYDNILSCSIIEVNKTLKSSENYVNYTLNNDSKETDDYVLRISDYSSNSCDFNTNTAQVYEKLKVMFQNPEDI